MTTNKSMAAACCVGNANIPFLIVTPSVAQVSLIHSYANIVAEAPHNGPAIFRDKSHKEYTHNTLLSGSIMLNERWQLAMQVPFVQRFYQNPPLRENDSGIGDLAVQVSYELLQQTLYHPYKPRVFLFSKFTHPTGNHVYQQNQSSPAVAMGTGFQQISAGFALLKTMGSFDIFSSYELSQGFSKGHLVNGQHLHITPGLSQSAALSLGHSPGRQKWRIALEATYFSQLGKKIKQATQTSKRTQRVWGAGISVAHQVSSSWSVMALYHDQTILAPAKNTLLARSLGLSLIKRWNR